MRYELLLEWYKIKELAAVEGLCLQMDSPGTECDCLDLSWPTALGEALWQGQTLSYGSKIHVCRIFPEKSKDQQCLFKKCWERYASH